MKKALGFTLISLPFIAIFIVGAYTIGWWQTALVFVGCFAVVIIIGFGLFLIKGGNDGR